MACVRVKLILPALTEAKSPFFRPIKYSLFPPLGLATLAGYLDDDDEITLQDEHVETLDLDDEPDLVVIQAYITSARRAYELADHYRRCGSYVVLGGLHVTALPEEAAPHADTIFLGPGEDTWPAFLAHHRAGRPAPRYRSTVRTLAGLPRIRRDLIKRHLYLVPNSIVVSRDARTPATSATRKPSSGRKGLIPRPWTTRWPRSIGSPAGTSTSSTIISSGTSASRPRSLRGCAA
jgi:radical SAM superfamily enzyme YgiQ (UPF0313 family)